MGETMVKTGRFVWGLRVVIVYYEVRNDESGKPLDVIIKCATEDGRPIEVQSWWHQPLMMSEVAEWNPLR
jgi:hypothetical protein